MTITEITQEMVGLKISNVRCANGKEFGDFTVHITLKEISDEGLEVFGLTEDDCQA